MIVGLSCSQWIACSPMRNGGCGRPFNWVVRRQIGAMSQEISFIRARIDDAGRIVTLVNRAYRGDSSRSGWTNEADLFDGPRTDESEVRDLIASDGSMILLCVQGTDIVGSVLLKKSESTAYLGMLVTDPLLQGAGIGSRLMQAAEAVAREQWGATGVSITVITCRDELVAFYQRRGYRRTGRIAPVPPDDLSRPRADNLQLEIMEKEIDR